MIKVITFDWFNTLAHYEPPREQIQSRALEKFGINVSPKQIIPALLVADQDYFEENKSHPIRKRSSEEQARIYAQYQERILAKLEVDISEQPDLPLKIMAEAQQLYQGIRFTLFDDVLPTLYTLKERGLTLGLLTNFDRDMQPICHELGLDPYIDFVITSADVGVDKPEAPIFFTALERAGVSASEAVHVGDQYKLDVLGARAVGINPILLDRYDFFPEVTDCPRISSLNNLIKEIT